MDTFSWNSDNLQDLVFFLIPGFITVYLFFYQIPDRKKSDLSLVILGVFLSVLLGGITDLFFAIVNFITNIGLNLSSDQPYFIYVKCIFAILLAIFLARFIKTAAFSRINKKLFNVTGSPFGRVWNAFFKDREKTVVKVFMDNGTVYVGVIRLASFDPEDEVQEIELWKPYYFDKTTNEITRIEESESVLIERSAIVSIEKISKDKAQEIYR